MKKKLKYILGAVTLGVLIKIFKTRVLLLLNIIGAFLLPIKPLLMMVGLMILIDTVTGILKARKLNEKITSHKLGQVISKMLLYQICVMTLYGLDVFIVGELVATFTSIPLFLTKLAATFFVGIEIVSINENLDEGYGINLFKRFKQMLIRAKNVKEDISGVIEK